MTTDPQVWQVLADSVLLVHMSYVLFIVGGQLLIVIGWARGWIWTRQFVLRLVHLLAIGLVMLEAWIGMACPLTRLEYALRARTGVGVYTHSFIGHWLDHLLFYSAPEWVFTVVYTFFSVIVALTWVVYPPRRQLIK
ncbi:MAG: DUF2784 domain-containing protein [Sulfuricaulis sp.]